MFRYDGFEYIGERDFIFFESGFHLKVKKFPFFFSKTLLVPWIEDAVISWVGWTEFGFYVVLETQFFISDL